jgi:Uma2 family endonuclease
MSAVIRKSEPYERLLALPENLVGEIIGGELYTQPRPSGPHASASSVLGMDIGSAYHLGRNGPGGWWIIDEPELHFIRDTEILVPNIAGWRRERMPMLPKDHRFEIVPDWVCEKQDRVIKMQAYTRYGVANLWLLDPLARILECYALTNGQWTVIGLYRDRDKISAAPFDAITVALSDL